MDKVDAYDKEQLQAMGWLFDETETPDTAVRFVEQDLTSEQQTQARNNIGISYDVYTLPYSALAKPITQEQSDAILVSAAICITDIPSEIGGSMDKMGPVMFVRSTFNGSNYPYFINVTTTDNDTFAFKYIVLDYTENFISGIIDKEVIASNALRVDGNHAIPIEQENYALSNIGLRYVVIQVTNGTATLTNAQQNAMLSARGVLIVGSTSYEPATRRVYTLGQTDGNIVSGYSLLSGSLLLTLSYNKTTKVLTVNVGSQPLLDQGAVRFNTVQELNETQQAQARENIGITQGLLNDADFIAELKTKLGLT